MNKLSEQILENYQFVAPPVSINFYDTDRVTFMQKNSARMKAYPTPQEASVWLEIKRRKIPGIKTQECLFGRYIADFCHRKKRLVFEIDGSQHYYFGFSNDAIRDAFLHRKNYHVTRFTNFEVETNIKHVVDIIEDSVRGA